MSGNDDFDFGLPDETPAKAVPTSKEMDTAFAAAVEEIQPAAKAAPVAATAPPKVTKPESPAKVAQKQAAVQGVKSSLGKMFASAGTRKPKQFANVLVYGDPGTGKTTMACRVSMVPGEVVYILTEPHHEATIGRENPGALLCVAHDWVGVLEALTEVEKALQRGEPIKYVVLDSLDDAQDAVVSEAFRRNAKADMRRVGGERNQGTMQILQRLRNLPVHTIVVCKAETRTFTLADGRTYDARYPRIAGKQMDVVAMGSMHAVCYTETVNVRGVLRYVAKFRTSDDSAWTKATGRLKPAYAQENFAQAIEDACDVGGESLTTRKVEVGDDVNGD